MFSSAPSGIIKSFASITPHLKFKTDQISIDNLAFKLHYRATFMLLLTSTVLVTSRQYIGEHIRCITDGSIPEHVINTFCFFTTTFTVVRHFNETLLEKGIIPHPGIGSLNETDDVRHHAYYQWVPFVLFAQAMMFYVPHLIWRHWEGGRIKALVDGLQMITLSKHMNKGDDLRLSSNSKVLSRDVVDSRVNIIKTEFLQHIRINKWFANRLIVAEYMNAFNLFLQIYWTNRFLGGQFFNLGLSFWRDDFTGRMDVLDTVFPKVTKCNFYKYGQSGSIQRHDALCVMALNVINEKIYVFLWFWYGFMAVVTIAALIWRFITIVMHSRFNGFVFSLVCPGHLNPWDMMEVTRHSSFSDWIFLYYLAKNMEPYLFRNMLVDLAKELKGAADLSDAPTTDPSRRRMLNANSHADNHPIESIDEVDYKVKVV